MNTIHISNSKLLPSGETHAYVGSLEACIAEFLAAHPGQAVDRVYYCEPTKTGYFPTVGEKAEVR